MNSIDIATLLLRLWGWFASRSSAIRDLRAEKLAEETGVAFQLTNILRDVKEDVERGRIYLPLDMLHEFGVSVDRVKSLAGGCGDGLKETARALLRSWVASQKLLWLCGSAAAVDRCGQPRCTLGACHDLSCLLLKISKADGDVFTERVSVSTRKAGRSCARCFADAAKPGGVVSREVSDVIVVGAGAAGLSAAAALVGVGKRVVVLERKPYVGGRAYSYEHPALGEVVDSQHVLLGCCTNLIELCGQAGSADKIRWYDRQTFLEPNGRSSTIVTSGCLRRSTLLRVLPRCRCWGGRTRWGWRAG